MSEETSGMIVQSKNTKRNNSVLTVNLFQQLRKEIST